MDDTQNDADTGAENGQQAELSLREEIERNIAELNEAHEQQTAAPDTPAAPAAAAPGTDASTPESKEAPAGAAAAKPATEAKVDPAAGAPAAAPQSWNASEKALWEKVPADVQAVISRREGEVHRAITMMGQDASLGRKINEAASPYMPMIRAEGADAVTAFQNLLQTAYVLRTAQPNQKAALFSELAQRYGVDLTALAASGAPKVDPAVAALQTEVQQMRADRERASQQQHQQFVDAAQAQIDAFRSDPANEFYEQARPLMQTLLANGQAQDLKQAYDMACHAIPDVRSTIQARVTADAEAKRAAEAKARADAKRRAGSSINGSSGSVSPANTARSDLSLRDEIKANLRAALNS